MLVERDDNIDAVLWHDFENFYSSYYYNSLIILLLQYLKYVFERKENKAMLVKCAAEMVAGVHYNIRIQWKNGFHKSAQVGQRCLAILNS